MPTLKTSNSPLVMPPRVPPGATYPWEDPPKGTIATGYPTSKPHKKTIDTDTFKMCQNVGNKSETRVEDTNHYERQNVSASSRNPNIFISLAGPSIPQTCMIRLALQEPVATSARLTPFPSPSSRKKHQSFSIKKPQRSNTLQRADMEMPEKMCDYHVFE